jgi:holin-like protein
MAAAFGVLIGLQLVGEVLRRTRHLPLLIGMVLLTIALVARGSAGAAAERAVPPSLRKLVDRLIANLGLLLVPAGVGIIADIGVLRHEWLAILGGLLISTALWLAVTGAVMQHASRVAGSRHRRVPKARPE